jgi:hypothetical protein
LAASRCRTRSRNASESSSGTHTAVRSPERIAALDQIYNSRAAGLPLYFGFRFNLVAGNTREAYQAGLRWGDPVLAINGRPFTGYVVLIEELRRSHAGDTLSVTFIPRPSPPDITKAVNPQDIKLPLPPGSPAGSASPHCRDPSPGAAEAAHRKRLNREIEIAREVQERMFAQSLPVVPGVDFAGRCRPALGVGGDYYDFFELKESTGGSHPLGLAIGDVSGKGISAALLMASLRASLRGMTRTSGDDLAAVLRDINQLVYEASANNRYATFFYAQFDPQKRLLSYVNAGHNAPVLLRRSAPDYQVLRLEACRSRRWPPA